MDSAITDIDVHINGGVEVSWSEAQMESMLKILRRDKNIIMYSMIFTGKYPSFQSNALEIIRARF